MGSELGIGDDKILDLAAYATSRFYDERERTALAYADAMTISGRDVSDELFELLRTFWDEDAIIELTAIIAFENSSSKFIEPCECRPRTYGRDGYCSYYSWNSEPAHPMEQIDRARGQRPPYDAVYVYEALHHAFSWREAIEASHECLKPGGWLLICEEPNVLHTFVSYRVSRLANTHEIGFSGSELLRHLRVTGFRPVRVLRNRVGLLVRPHWNAARKES